MNNVNPILAAVERENIPHLPDPAQQEIYAERHGDRAKHGYRELSDVQVASRARMLMRDDWTHEAVCTTVRDRICALVLEKQALIEAASALRTAQRNYMEVRTAERGVREEAGQLVAAAADALDAVLTKVRGEA